MVYLIVNITANSFISKNQSKDPSPNPQTAATKDDESRERRHTGGNPSDKPPLPPEKHGPPPSSPPPPVPGGTGNISQNKLSLQQSMPPTKGKLKNVIK